MHLPERYTLLQSESVDRGSMGCIYHAWDTVLKRAVAIKHLYSSESNAEIDLAGALREARILAQVSHPAVLQVYDVVETPSEVFIVSEWLEGKNLSELPLPLHPLAVISIAGELLGALTAVHGAQVIHRDIKPANVILCNSGRLVLLDFGIAYGQESSAGLTLAGTPRYSCPGRLEGTPPDFRSDLFSLGLVLLELQTGECVLPALAPLPLYRFLNQKFKSRVHELSKGVFPPFFFLIEDLFNNYSASEGIKAEEYARRVKAIFSHFSSLTAQEFLKKHVVQNLPMDLNEKFQTATQLALHDSSLSPKLRAQWMSFERQSIVKVKKTLTRNIYWLLVASVATVLFFAPRIQSARPKHQNRPTELYTVTPTPIATPVASNTATPMPTQLPTVVPAHKHKTPQMPPKVQWTQIYLSANAWADVYIDSQWKGRLPLAKPLVMNPGEHTIRLENPLTQPFEKKIILAPGASLRQHFLLEAKTQTTESDHK